MKAHLKMSTFLWVLPLVLNGACKNENGNVDSDTPPVPVEAPVSLQDRHGSRDEAKRPIAVDESLIDMLRRGDGKAWDQAIDGKSDAEVWAIVEQGYRQLKGQKKKLIGTIHAKAMYSKVPATLVSELYTDFSSIEAPEALRIPPDKRGWEKIQEIVHSPKYKFASVIMGAGDPDTMAKVWKEFPEFSETDQQIIGMAADKTEELSQVPVIAAAAESAKSEEIRESLLNGANRVVAHALKVPEKRGAAMAMARQLETDDLVRPLLVDTLKKLGIERPEIEPPKK